MFDSINVVESAVSAFNNAALVAPAFLWWALLAVPLFILVWYCGGAFLDKLGWNRENMLSRTGLVTVIMTFVWLILFGGNYDVLRDKMSVLPFVNAGILCFCALFVASWLRGIKLPKWRDATRGRRLLMACCVFLFFMAVGLTDLHVWWGPVLQICAVIFGLFIGSRMRTGIAPMIGTILVMTATVTAILIQPEYFRFGQLGNLTIFHKFALVCFGAFAVAAIVFRNILPSHRIHQSAYVKLKLLLRIVSVLALALFCFTESVPVFFSFLGAVFILFALSVWHRQFVPVFADELMFAMAVCAFGVITVMPAITALGILYLNMLPHKKLWADNKFLL